jgi:hypothetical protein
LRAARALADTSSKVRHAYLLTEEIEQGSWGNFESIKVYLFAFITLTE